MKHARSTWTYIPAKYYQKFSKGMGVIYSTQYFALKLLWKKKFKGVQITMQKEAKIVILAHNMPPGTYP